MDDLQFYVLFNVFKSYQDEGCVQWNLLMIEKIFASSGA